MDKNPAKNKPLNPAVQKAFDAAFFGLCKVIEEDPSQIILTKNYFLFRKKFGRDWIKILDLDCLYIYQIKQEMLNREYDRVMHEYCRIKYKREILGIVKVKKPKDPNAKPKKKHFVKPTKK